MQRHNLSNFIARRHDDTFAPRAGSVLLIVLVIIVLLSLSIYTFTNLSLSELEATNMYGRAVQSRAFADSGIDVALTVLGSGSDHAGESFVHRPDLFVGILRDSPAERGRGRFSIVSPVENVAGYGALRYGLINESSKINVNSITKLGLNEEQSRNLLLPLPGMTPELADALLDWLDSDQNPRFQGAENEYYQSLPTPYGATNGAVGSLDELLLVRGVTPQLLYGEDVNRNGWVEAQEDNGDGVPQVGWNSFLTTLSRERNVRPDGTAKINLNSNTLIELYDQLENEFDGEVARFVIGFRMSGDRNAPTDQNAQTGATGANGQGQGGTGNQGSSNSNSGGNNGNTNNNRGNNGSSSNNSNSSNNANSNSGGSNGGGGGGGGSGRGGRGGGGNNSRRGNQGGQGGSSQAGNQASGQQQQDQMRGGIDLSAGAKITINSIYDLVDAEVEVTIDGEQTVLKSPWSSSAGDLNDYLPHLMETVATNQNEFVEGRININQTWREVILGLPEMTEAMADKIVAAASVGADGQAVSETFDSRPTNGWLLAEGIVTLEQMRKLDKYVTTKGDVYRLQSVGYFEKGGPVSRVEAVIDATKQPPVLMFARDLSELGTGYSVDQLMGR